MAKRDYDALGRVTRTTVGDYGSQVVSTQQYDWATGRVVNSFLDRQNGTVSADQTTYTYTPSGRITSATDLQDARDRDLQCYTYDHLGRLTNAWTDTGTTYTTADWTDSSGAVHGTGSSTTVPATGGCTNANGPAVTGPGSRTVGGPAPYWNTYSHDATGNRTGLVQHDITGDTAKDVTTTQTFGAARTTNTGNGKGGPHALQSSITVAPSGTRTTGYQYDANGNTTAVSDNSGTATLTWNSEDRLASYAKTGGPGTTSYLDDADGNPLIRRNPGRTTLSLPTDEVTLDMAAHTTAGVRSVPASGGLTYTRVSNAVGGSTVLYQAADPHGTNGVQIGSDAAMTVTRRLTDPFGNARGPQPSASAWAGTKGFVGGLQDATTGLTTLGARVYDPATGRFLSDDPVTVNGSPQQWNGYAYSDNDPVNGSDPSGLCRADICGVGTVIGGTGSGPDNPVRFATTGPVDPDDPSEGTVYKGTFIPGPPKKKVPTTTAKTCAGCKVVTDLPKNAEKSMPSGGYDVNHVTVYEVSQNTWLNKDISDDFNISDQDGEVSRTTTTIHTRQLTTQLAAKIGGSVSVKTSVSASLPFLADGEVEVAVSLNGELSWQNSDAVTDAKQDSVTLPTVKVKAGQAYGLSPVGTATRYMAVFVHTDGSTTSAEWGTYDIHNWAPAAYDHRPAVILNNNAGPAK
ncbi:RHS repeat-associated core domain-containing protein [Streptomyces sp. CB01881]|uniref:RHS repeat-associated core domain-containing protein n=1 Tax=Streptomyces sp. CB01881 TaxID=2078691 RepID=UPI000CDBC381|nr:RHS repeat-associated core domain-containing protein [Streptomyces sp. CB01881]AUY49139.1 hypothetical protein C2142_09555 [Streptomyces sp. CB01881]TYC77632.1 RHS repeat-associated core domain-containing protein [Streptomyces sp. CB01881]